MAISELKDEIARKDLICCCLHLSLENFSQWWCAELEKPAGNIHLLPWLAGGSGSPIGLYVLTYETKPVLLYEMTD